MQQPSESIGDHNDSSILFMGYSVQNGVNQRHMVRSDPSSMSNKDRRWMDGLATMLGAWASFADDVSA